MRGSTVLLVATTWIVVVAVSISSFYVGRLFDSLDVPEKLYLEACKAEIGPWRATKALERRYGFHEMHHDIDVVYTWVNGSDPLHLQGTECQRSLESSPII
jgi:hypothetical protein